MEIDTTDEKTLFHTEYEKCIIYKGSRSFLSNWYPCTIKYMVNGIIETYENVEQGYFHCRLLKLGYIKEASEAKKEKRAWKIKELYGKLKSPPNNSWFQEREKVMEEIIFCKYSQNTNLGEQLKATGSKPLIEATRDMHWGGGYNFDSDQYKEGRVKGLNMHGILTMRVRHRLLKQ